MNQFCAIMLISAVIGEIEPFVTRVTKMDATVKSLCNRTLRIEHLVYTFILGMILYHLNRPILIELEGQFIA